MQMNHATIVRVFALMLFAALTSGLAPATERRMANAETQAPQERPSGAQPESPAPNRVVEIRCYNLKSGTRDRFHQLFVQVSLPLLERFKVDVVAYGPSLHDSDSYYLMRSYASLEERQKSEDAFYGSDDWRKGPREAVMADIESYTTAVVQLDDAAIQGLRRTSARPRSTEKTAQ